MNSAAPARDNCPPLGGAVRLFTQKYERIAFYLLLAWCLLPALISVCYPICALLGLFPAREELAAAAAAGQATLGSINYRSAQVLYHTLYFILGAITCVFSLACVSLSAGRVFRAKSMERWPWFYLLAFILVWALISTAFSYYLYRAIVGNFSLRDGLVSYFIFAAVFICASVIRRDALRRTLIRTFAGVISYLAVLMLVQENVDSDFLNYCFSSTRATVFNQFNHFGYMLCMAALSYAGLYLFDRGGGKARRWLYLAGVLFTLYALIVNDTFGAQLAAIIALPILYIIYLASGRKADKRLLVLMLVLLLVLLLICFAVPSVRILVLRNVRQLRIDVVTIFTNPDAAASAGTGRFGLWKQTVQRIAKRPIFGYGPLGLIGKYALKDNYGTHNEFLQMAAYLGIPALALYLAALIGLAYRQCKRLRELDPMVLAASGVVTAYLISSFFGTTVYNTTPYFWMFLGFATGTREDEEPLICPGAEYSPAAARCGRLFAGGCLLLAAVLTVTAAVSLRNERQKEYADLRVMQAAELRARETGDVAALRTDKNNLYWYDKDKDAVYPVTRAMPAPYGVGTDRDGGGRVTFAAKYGTLYSYDNAADTSGSVVIVMAVPDGTGDAKFTPVWYEKPVK